MRGNRCAKRWMVGAAAVLGLLAGEGVRDAAAQPVPPGEVLYALGQDAPVEQFQPPGPVSLYTVDQTTGVVTQIGPTGRTDLRGLAIHPVTGVIYASSRTGGILRPGGGPGELFTLDATTGAATLVGSTGVERGLFGLDFASDGTLYANAAGAGETIYTVDTTTGLATPLFVDARFSWGLAVEPGDERLLGTEGISYSTYHLPTGTSAFLDPGAVALAMVIEQRSDGIVFSADQVHVGTQLWWGPADAPGRNRRLVGDTGIAIRDLAFGPLDGRGPPPPPIGPPTGEVLYALGEPAPVTMGGPPGPVSLYVLDEDTGASTLIGATGRNDLRGLAAHPVTGVIYASSRTGPRGNPRVPGDLYTLDPSTGGATLVGNTGAGVGLFALDFAGDGTLYGNAGSYSPQVYTVDSGTGLATGLFTDNRLSYGLAVVPGDAALLGTRTSSSHLYDLVTGTVSLVDTTPSFSPVLEQRSDGTVFTSDFIGTGTNLWSGPEFAPFSQRTLVGDTGVAVRELAFGPSFGREGPRRPANGFLHPIRARAPQGGTLLVAATLDLGDKTVDFADPGFVQVGGTSIVLPRGLTPNARRTRWTWTSDDRWMRFTIVLPGRSRWTSKVNAVLYVRHWDETLPAYPEGGEALRVAFGAGTYGVMSNVQLLGGTHRANRELADAPPLALDRVAARLRGRGAPHVALTATFAGDGQIPPTPPTVSLSIGRPGSTYDVTVPTPAHVTIPTASGYQFRIPATGPGRRGAWFVDVDYVRRRVRVFATGEEIGDFPRRGTAPFHFGLGFDGTPNAVEVCVESRANRLSYR